MDDMRDAVDPLSDEALRATLKRACNTALHALLALAHGDDRRQVPDPFVERRLDPGVIGIARLEEDRVVRARHSQDREVQRQRCGAGELEETSAGVMSGDYHYLFRGCAKPSGSAVKDQRRFNHEGHE